MEAFGNPADKAPNRRQRDIRRRIAVRLDVGNSCGSLLSHGVIVLDLPGANLTRFQKMAHTFLQLEIANSQLLMSSPVLPVCPVVHSLVGMGEKCPKIPSIFDCWPTLQAVFSLIMHEVTQILSAIDQGDPHASEKLLPLVYDELRKLAAQKLTQEAPGQTLQATALVHEAYLRLVDVDKVPHWDSRGHFFAAAAEAMRRILIDSARRKQAERHGG